MQLSFPPQAQPHAEHGAARIHEDGWASEIRAEQIVRRQLFLGGVIEHIEHVHEKFDTCRFVRQDRFRQAHVKQRLRRQLAGTARLQQNAPIALGQQNLGCRRPRLAAEVLEVGCNCQARPWHVGLAHYPEYVWAVVRQPAATPVPRLRFRWLVLIVAVVVGAGVLAWRLNRSDYWWRNPLANAQFTPVTDFPEAEGDAVISRDGKFVAFLSDRDGPSDIWAGQIGTGEFQNLTKGRAPDIGNPRVRNLGFSPDGSQVSVEVRIAGRVYSWAVPTIGGSVHPYMDGVELAWSPDGTRIAYHTDGPGDPVFVSAPDEKTGKQIYAAERGVHCHYLGWSPDGAFIYFVQGFPPDEMDIWRIRPDGGQADRITFHNSRVAYPTLLNKRTLLYIARADDGTGPWLYAMDVERRVPHRISFGVERYTSIAASADGRRLVATVANPEASLWRVPISDRMAEEPAARRIPLPTVRGLSPRIGPEYMLYLSSKGGNDGIWKSADGTAVELWSGSLGRVLEGAAISPDGSRIAFTAQKSGRNSRPR